MVLRPTRVHNLNGILIGSTIFAQLATVNCKACPGIFSSLKVVHSYPIHDSLGSLESTVQIAPQCVQCSAIFARPPNTDGSIVFARWHQCAPHLTHAFLGPPKSTTQTTSRSAQPFLHRVSSGMPGHVLSSKNCAYAWGPIQYTVPCAHQSPNLKQHLDWYSRFCTAHGR